MPGSSKRTKGSHPRKPAAAAPTNNQDGNNDVQARPAHDNFSDPEAEVEAEVEAEAEAEGESDQAQVQTGEELGAEPVEGRGEEGASVISSGSQKYQMVHDETGNIQKITFYRSNCPPVVMERPNDDSEAVMLWDLLESQRRGARRKRELVSAINKARDLLVAVSGGGSRARTDSPARTVARTRGVQPSDPYEWMTKTLPPEVARDIETTYFLQIEESVKDRNGNPYVPARIPPGPEGKWRGSMLGGKFPHAIVSMRKPESAERTEEYMCGLCHKVGLNVRLKKFSDNRSINCSEAEVLEKISNAFPLSQRSLWGSLETKLLLYCYLEFADDPDHGTPVTTNAFDKLPDSGFIFKPHESPPSYLNSGKPGFYEFAVRKGLAHCPFKFQEAVTTANLTKENRHRLFRLVVKAINPFLAGLEGMTARSSPFVIKSVLHNDYKKNERYVRGPDGVVVASGPQDLPTA